MSGRPCQLFLPLLVYLLSDLGTVVFSRLPDSVDFYYDPLMPRVNDTLTLEADPFLNKPLRHLLKKGDYRWYYREIESPPSAFRLIGVGQYLTLNVTSEFSDGYFNLSVVFCCNSDKKLVQLENVKLIRIQRSLTLQVFLNGNPLPGNLSVSSLALSKPHVNIECRITGMPTSFALYPPLGVYCAKHRIRNKRRYIAVVRRRCRFYPGTYKCSARNDLSEVVMLHYVQAVEPATRSLESRNTPKTSVVVEPTPPPEEGSAGSVDEEPEREKAPKQVIPNTPVVTTEVKSGSGSGKRPWIHVSIGSKSRNTGARGFILYPMIVICVTTQFLLVTAY